MLRLKIVSPLLLTAILLCGQSGLREAAHARSFLPLDSIKAGSLCAKGERTVWSCETLRERKLASICSSQALDKSRGYLQYRFGRPGKIELEFPKERTNTQAVFRYARYTRPLVAMLNLKFVNNGFTYTIGDDDNEEEKPPVRDAAITITPSGANSKETTLRCRLPITGSLMTLEDVVQNEEFTGRE